MTGGGGGGTPVYSRRCLYQIKRIMPSSRTVTNKRRCAFFFVTLRSVASCISQIHIFTTFLTVYFTTGQRTGTEREPTAAAIPPDLGLCTSPETDAAGCSGSSRTVPRLLSGEG